MAQMIDAPGSIDRFINDEVEKYSLRNALIAKRFDWSTWGEKCQGNGRTRRINMELVQSASLTPEIPDNKETNRNACSTSTSSNQSNILQYQRRGQDRGSRRHHGHQRYYSLTPRAHKRDFSESCPAVLVSMNGRYQNAVEYCCYHLNHKSNGYDDDMASGMQLNFKNIVIYMKDRAFKRRNLISFILDLAKLKQACNFPCIDRGAAVWLFQEFMDGWRHDAKRAWFTPISNDPNMHEGSIRAYVKTVNKLWSNYSSYLVAAEVEEENPNYKQRSLTPWYFSRTSSSLAV